MLYTNTLDDSQQPPTYCLLCLHASIMINWAGLSWDINLQLNIQIISPKNTNYVYVISALWDNSQSRVRGNILQGVSTIKLIWMSYWTSCTSRVTYDEVGFFFFFFMKSCGQAIVIYSLNRTHHCVFVLFVQHLDFRLHCFSVAGTCEGSLDDKYTSAETVSGKLGAGWNPKLLSSSLPSHALFFAPASSC